MSPWPAPDPANPRLPDPDPSTRAIPRLATSGQPTRQPLPESAWFDARWK